MMYNKTYRYDIAMALLFVALIALSIFIGFTSQVRATGPPPPDCTIPTQSGRIIVQMGSTAENMEASQLRTDIKKTFGPVTLSSPLPAGKYKITVESYDDHTTGTPTQPNEQWYAQFWNGNNQTQKTNATADLPDHKWRVVEELHNEFTATQQITKISAVHNASSGINSVTPVCIAFDPIEEEEEEEPENYPACPISPAANRTIINLAAGKDTSTSKLFAHATKAQSELGPINAVLDAGTYTVTLVSYDDHSAQPGLNQPNEEWYLSLLKDAAQVGVTPYIADLPDSQDMMTQVVAANYVLPGSVNQVLAKHKAYQNSNVNSIVPICAAFDKKVEEVQCEEPELPNISAKGGKLGDSFSYTIEQTGGSGNLTLLTTLPDGLSFDGTKISGKLEELGEHTIELKSTNSCGSDTVSFTLEVDEDEEQCEAVVLDLPNSVDGTVGEEFSYKIPTNGGTPSSIEVSDLPEGLEFTGSRIVGTPEEEGTFTVTVEAENSCGDDEETFKIEIEEEEQCSASDDPSITTPASQFIKPNEPFSLTLQTNGKEDRLFVLGLPDGLEFDGDDRISGTTNAIGTYLVRLLSNNECGAAETTFTISISTVAAISLAQLPETGPLFALGNGSMLLYFFVVVMACGALYLVLTPALRRFIERRK